jgi:DNA invertase Pin-like site-specific DNA recombinase
MNVATWSDSSRYSSAAAVTAAGAVSPVALFAMLNAADRGDFDVIVLRDVDRLGGDTHRNGVMLSDLLEWLRPPGGFER